MSTLERKSGWVVNCDIATEVRRGHWRHVAEKGIVCAEKADVANAIDHFANTICTLYWSWLIENDPRADYDQEDDGYVPRAIRRLQRAFANKWMPMHQFVYVSDLDHEESDGFALFVIRIRRAALVRGWIEES